MSSTNQMQCQFLLAVRFSPEPASHTVPTAVHAVAVLCRPIECSVHLQGASRNPHCQVSLSVVNLDCLVRRCHNIQNEVNVVFHASRAKQSVANLCFGNSLHLSAPCLVVLSSAPCVRQVKYSTLSFCVQCGLKRILEDFKRLPRAGLPGAECVSFTIPDSESTRSFHLRLQIERHG